MYHYTECGLPYVYLANGYHIEQGPFGETVAIDNVDELHRTIARWIVEHLDHLRGREVRFLRLEMDYTQGELAAAMGVQEQTLSLWERSPDKTIPAPSDRLLRVFCESWLDDDQPIAGALERLRYANTAPSDEPLSFRHTVSAWEGPTPGEAPSRLN